MFIIDFKYNSSFRLDMLWGGSFNKLYEYIFYINKKGNLSLDLRINIIRCDNIFGIPSFLTKKSIKNINIENISHPFINSHKSYVLNIFNQLKKNINHYRNNILNELLEFSLNPNRIQWIFDETQKKYWNNFKL